MVVGDREKENKMVVKIIGFGEAYAMDEEATYKPMQLSSRALQDDIEVIDLKKSTKKGLKVLDKAHIMVSFLLMQEAYRSPEQTTIENISKQDIWSCGVLLQTILSKIFGVEKFMSLPKPQLTSLMLHKSRSV